MAKRRFGIVILLICFCLCMLPSAALAASTTDAKEQINTDKECTLTISYHYGETAFPDQTVNLYQIADVSADYQYTLTSAFAPSGLMLNGIQTNGEWNVIRSTLEAHILAHNTAPVMSAVTDASGKACFESLKPGLYLASAVHVLQDDLCCAFDSALVALPGLSADGYWQYQVAVAAKPEISPPIAPDTEIERKLLKLWKGDKDQTTRPQSIEVEIFHNGTSYATVALSEENHWSYSWSTKDDGADWKVIEQNVPSGYTMTVEQRETTFVITNTYADQPDPRPPQTGDTSNILLYTVLMYVSGTMLIILGLAGKRKRHEETN